MPRELLLNRRKDLIFDFPFHNTVYSVSVGYYPDGRIGEIFLRVGKSGTHINTYVRDSAIAISFALQYGATIEDIRSALTRDAQGVAEGPLGALLDMLVKDQLL